MTSILDRPVADTAKVEAPPAEAEVYTVGQMRLVTHKGVETVDWDTRDEATVKIAEQKFAEARATGMLGYATPAGKTAEQMTEFDAHTEAITFTAPLVGG